jgi:uncharacterized protein GlcG (DUF336 family)
LGVGDHGATIIRRVAARWSSAACCVTLMVSLSGGDAMSQITLLHAQTIINAGLAAAREKKLQPLAIVVLDARGVLKAYAAEDGTSLRRAEIATGKAHGALAFGVGSRTLGKRAEDRPHFIAAVTHAVGGMLVPVPGGVLVRGEDGSIIAAVGVSGDTSDNDEGAALAGIAAAGLKADPT